MGLGGISPWSLVLILVIVLLLFGTKKLKGLGGDLGSAIKGFKDSMSDDGKKEEDAKKVAQDEDLTTEKPTEKTAETVNATTEEKTKS